MKSKVAVVFALVMAIYFVYALTLNIYIQREITFALMDMSVLATHGLMINSFENSDSKDAARMVLGIMPEQIKKIKTTVINSWKPYSYLLILPDNAFVMNFWEKVFIQWMALIDMLQNHCGSEDIQRVAPVADQKPEAEAFTVALSKIISDHYHHVDVRISINFVSSEEQRVVAMGDPLPLPVYIRAEAGLGTNVIGSSAVDDVYWIDTNQDHYSNAGKYNK